MTTSSDSRTPLRHTMRVTEPTSPQSVLERPTRPSAGATTSRSPEAERPLRLIGWLAALAAVAALAIVGAAALSGGEEVDLIETSTPSAGLVTTPAADGYWNAYTLEWVPFQTANTTPTADGYWNAYTLEWVPLQTANTTPTADGYWNPYTLEWVPSEG